MSSQPEPHAVSPLGPLADDDAVLIRAAAAGDASAFSRLYDRYYKIVARRLSHLLGPKTSHATVDDLAQDTFVRAMHALPSFRGDSPFRFWLLRIAMSVARDEQRRTQRSLWRLFFSSADEQRAAQQTSSETATADAYADLRAVHDALATLTPRLREVVVLFELEGESLAEIAALLEVPLHTVGSRLRRGREQLREALRRAGYEEAATATTTSAVVWIGERI